MSASISSLAKALVAAQAELTAVSKDAANPFFKSNYTSFAALMDALRGPFAKQGLALVQPTGIGADGNPVVETMLIHTSGEWIMGELTGKPVKSDPQGLGSLMTYLKRYGAQAIAGVASKDDDDDGNAASGRGGPQKPPQQSRPNQPPPTKAAQPPVRSAPPARSPPSQEREYMPFPYGGNAGDDDEIFTGLPDQWVRLRRDAKMFNISDEVSIQNIGMLCKEHMLVISNMPNAIQEWIADRKRPANGEVRAK